MGTSLLSPFCGYVCGVIPVPTPELVLWVRLGVISVPTFGCWFWSDSCTPSLGLFGGLVRPSGSLTPGVSLYRRGGVWSGFRVPSEADLIPVPVARECRGDSRFRSDPADDFQERVFGIE